MIFIDSNIFISYYNLDDENHELAINIIKNIEDGKYGDAFTSDYVFDEVITVTLIRLKNKESAIKLGSYILKSKIKLLKLNKDIFMKALELFQESDLKMSFTDCTNLAFLNLLNIKNIATFDKEFKKIKNIMIVDV